MKQAIQSVLFGNGFKFGRFKSTQPKPMPIAKETSSFEPAPAGTHIARCYGCVALGTQHSEMFADAFKVLLMFELPFEKMNTQNGEMPMTVSKEYTLSLGKKSNLRKHLDSWRGRAFTEEELKGFEVSKVVGAPCQLTIVHQQNAKTGNTFAKIESITGLAKGMNCPDQSHPNVRFEIEEGKSEAYNALPEWIRKKIDACEEWQPTKETATTPEPTSDPAEDDVPF